jgi:hypothetical protein
MGENITLMSSRRGGLGMKDSKKGILDEEFILLESKIKGFQERVKGFQKDMETKLKQDRYCSVLSIHFLI